MVEILFAKYLGINKRDSNIKNTQASQSKLANTMPLEYAAPKLATNILGLTFVLKIDKPTLYQGSDLPDKNISSEAAIPLTLFLLLMYMPIKTKKRIYPNITIASASPI
jgi:hypothetical protein